MALCFAAQQARDSDFKETQPSASFNAVIKPRWSVRRPPPFNTEVVIDSLLAEREPRWAFVVGGLFPPADKRTHLCPLALLLTAAAVGSCAGWQQQQKWGPWLGGPPLQDGHWGGIVTLLDPWGRSTSPHDLGGVPCHAMTHGREHVDMSCLPGYACGGRQLSQDASRSSPSSRDQGADRGSEGLDKPR